MESKQKTKGVPFFINMENSLQIASPLIVLITFATMVMKW